MSAVNGDKSRFNRERKQKIARRTRNRQFLKLLAEPAKSTGLAPATKPKAVSA
jgi:hypothetical protein